MNFKLWLELADPELESISKYLVNPDNFYTVSGFDTFIFDPKNDKLYVIRSDSEITHGQLLDRYNIRNNKEYYLYGRFGQINEDNINDYKFRDKPELNDLLPLDIISFWPNWSGQEKRTSQEIDFCINKFLNASFGEIEGNLTQKIPISNETIVIDGIRTPHYVREKSIHSLKNKQYQIGSFRFTSENVRDWMGKLHYLPPTSPERNTILHYAELIANSPYAKEFPDFISRTNFKTPMKRNSWNQELQKQKLGGYNDLWRGTSEGAI